jgi:hypothetical protein
MKIKYTVQNKHLISLDEVVNKINSLIACTCEVLTTTKDGVIIQITFSPSSDEQTALLVGVLIGTIQCKHIALNTVAEL